MAVDQQQLIRISFSLIKNRVMSAEIITIPSPKLLLLAIHLTHPKHGNMIIIDSSINSGHEMIWPQDGGRRGAAYHWVAELWRKHNFPRTYL